MKSSRSWMRFALAAFAVFLLSSITLASDEPKAGIDPDSTFGKAWALYQAGKTTEAVNALNKLLKNRDADTKVRFNAAYTLAVISIDAGSTTNTLSLLKKADKLIPDRPQVALRRAQAYVAAKQLKASKKSLKKADKLISKKKQPDLYAKLQLVYASFEEHAGARQRAITRLTKAAQSAPKNWRLHFELARLYELEDQPKPAIAAYQRVIQLDPKQGPYRGIYAYQRHAALSVASDPQSYGKPGVLDHAIDYYKIFLSRAAESGVDQRLVDNVRRTIRAYEQFRK